MCRLASLRIGALVAAVLFLGAAPPAASGSPTPSALLQLLEAGNRVPYQGTQQIEMFPQGRRVCATATVAHMHRSTRTEIQAPARLRGMVILERGRERLVRRPGEERWQASPSVTILHPRYILRNYTIAAAGSGQIAGQAAWIVPVRSRATGKLARKLWLDRQTGVVLRAEHYSWASRLIYVTQFKSIDYTARSAASQFEVPADQIVGESPLPAPPDPSAVPKPTYLPPGFRPVGKPQQVRMRRSTAIHLRYADGLNVLSAFIRKLAPGESPKRRPPSPSGDQPFSLAIHYVKGDLRITLIGDLNPVELRKMAESFE